MAALVLIGASLTGSAEAQILGTAESFAVLAGSTVTNTGTSVINGNVGLSPGTAIVGFPPGIVSGGTLHAGDAVAGQAQADLTIAYNYLMSRPYQFDLTGRDLGGMVLIGGVYHFATSAQLTGLLTLNGQGNSASEWIFQIGSTLTTASNSAVLLINGANANNVYWAVGSSATLGTNSVFAGTIIALTSITLNTGATINCGRALARNGAVTLDNNTITLCASNGSTTSTSTTGSTTSSTTGSTTSSTTGTTTSSTTGTTTSSTTGSTTSSTTGTTTSSTTGTTTSSTTGSTTSSTTGSGSSRDISLNALFGEGTSGAQQTAFSASGLFGSAMLREATFWREGNGLDFTGVTAQTHGPMKLGAGESGPYGLAPASYQARTWRMWATGFGGMGSLDGNAATGSAGLHTHAAGYAIGLDSQIDRTTLVGVSGGHTISRFSVADRATTGTVEGVHAGLYGVKLLGPFYLAATADYGHFNNATERAIEWVVSERAFGHFTSDVMRARVEAGWKQSFDGRNVTPFAGMQVARLWSEGYSEGSVRSNGDSGLLGLTFGSRTVDSLASSIGLQLDTRVALANGMTLTPFARVAWVHEFNTDRSVNASLTLSPSVGFSSVGALAASDVAKVNAGLKLDINKSIGLFAFFDGEFSDRSQSYAGNGGFRISW